MNDHSKKTGCRKKPLRERGLTGLLLFLFFSGILSADPSFFLSGKPADNSPYSFSLPLKEAGIHPAPGFSLCLISANQSGETSEKSGEERPGTGKDPRTEKKCGRGMLEFGILMTYSQARYWIKYSQFIEDWQYRLTWKDQKRRFFTTEAIRFDSNAYKLNWTHGFAGVLYYNFGRSNNWSWMESFLLSLGGSLWWEYVTEWREVISVNDNIFTAFGGLGAGEPWAQMGKYFNSHSGLFNQLVGFLNPLYKLNRWLDRKKLRKWPPEKEPGWHKFGIFVGGRSAPTASSTENRTNLFLGFHNQIIHPPEYGRPGEVSAAVKDTLLSEMSLDYTVRNGKMEEVEFFSRAALCGYFKQRISNGARGYSYYFGLGSAFTYMKKKAVAFYDSPAVKVKQGVDLHLEEPRDFRDKLSAVHIAGPVFDLTLFYPKSRFRLVADAYLDFALVNAYALNPYSLGRNLLGSKTTVLYYGYYYGIGTTLSTALTYNFKAWELSGLVRYQAYDSIEGLDRFQKEVTDDFNINDSRLSYKLGIRLNIPGTPVEVLGSFEGVDRAGRIRDVERQRLENRYSLGLNYRF